MPIFREYIIDPYKGLDEEMTWSGFSDIKFRTIYGLPEIIEFRNREILLTRNRIERKLSDEQVRTGKLFTAIIGYVLSKPHLNVHGKEVIDIEVLSSDLHDAVRSSLPKEYRDQIVFWQ